LKKAKLPITDLRLDTLYLEYQIYQPFTKEITDNMLKTLIQLIGLLLIVGSVGLGLYIGIWVLFIGGIAQIINNVTPTINALGIAIGIFKVIYAGGIGILTFILSLIVGKIMLGD